MCTIIYTLCIHGCVQVKGEAFTKHKIQPTFYLSKDFKFHPKFPCQICFPISHQNAQAANREDTGVRDLVQDSFE